MSVNIKGLKELERNINAELTSRKSNKLMNDAVNAGGDKVVSNLKNEFSKYKGSGYSTGATSDEIVRSNARMTNLNGRQLKVGWNGPKERYRLVHLNEFGYTKKGRKYTHFCNINFIQSGKLHKEMKTQRNGYP